MLVKVGPRGQITIPKNLRESLGIKPGDNVAIVQDGNFLKLQPVTKTLYDLAGSIKTKKPLDWDEIQEIVKQNVATRIMESMEDE